MFLMSAAVAIGAPTALSPFPASGSARQPGATDSTRSIMKICFAIIGLLQGEGIRNAARIRRARNHERQAELARTGGHLESHLGIKGLDGSPQRGRIAITESEVVVWHVKRIDGLGKAVL